MRNITRTSMLLASVALLGLGTAANAAVSQTVTVRVPFPFIVNGQDLPAGRYTVQHDGAFSSVLWIRGIGSNRASAIVLTSPAVGKDPAGSMPALEFARGEKQMRLRSVWESGGHGWSVGHG